jgi:hypothetical protein
MAKWPNDVIEGVNVLKVIPRPGMAIFLAYLSIKYETNPDWIFDQ